MAISHPTRFSKTEGPVETIETNSSFTYDKRHHDEDWRPADSGDLPLSPSPYELSESGPWRQGDPSEPIPESISALEKLGEKGRPIRNPSLHNVKKWSQAQGKHLTGLMRKYPVATLAIGTTFGGLLGVWFAKKV